LSQQSICPSNEPPTVRRDAEGCVEARAVLFWRIMKVLIADDSALIRDRLVIALSTLVDVEVVCAAHDAQEAVQAFDHLRPDAVVLDLRMPHGGGFWVLKAIKRIKPTVLTIVLTSYPYKAYRDRCMEDGADHFLHKATEFNKVTALIQQFQHCHGRVAPDSVCPTDNWEPIT